MVRAVGEVATNPVAQAASKTQQDEGSRPLSDCICLRGMAALTYKSRVLFAFQLFFSFFFEIPFPPLAGIVWKDHENSRLWMNIFWSPECDCNRTELIIATWLCIHFVLYPPPVTDIEDFSRGYGDIAQLYCIIQKLCSYCLLSIKMFQFSQHEEVRLDRLVRCAEVIRPCCCCMLEWRYIFI